MAMLAKYIDGQTQLQQRVDMLEKEVKSLCFSNTLKNEKLSCKNINLQQNSNKVNFFIFFHFFY